MKAITTFLLSAALALLAGNAAAVDLTGIWMPTTIAPNGTRNRAWPEKLPFLPQTRSMIEAYNAGYNKLIDDPGRSCLPYGMPYQMLLVAQYPMEIVQTKGRISVIFELHNDVRRIYLDGRKHPSGLLRTWHGHSIGRWQNDELIVETVGIRELGPPRPQSPAMKITEHIRLISGDQRGPLMEVKMVLDDPLTYSEPVVATNYYVKVPDLQMGEYFCSEDLWRQVVTGDTAPIPWR